MCFYSQPNLPAHPRSRRLARKIHMQAKNRPGPVITTAGDYNRRSSQPQPGQLALYQRHSAFGAAPRARQGNAPRVRQAIRPHALGVPAAWKIRRPIHCHQAPRARGATYARRGATRQNSGQNLVEGFAGAGVGVDRAG